ncbi:MAG: thrombospondin type 3 repeat-containing protein [Deltaproteobacteria bacterium]|nr:thrombospondin type 3 repeat-containing protein [Deltaproteobacteria bacterium]
MRGKWFWIGAACALGLVASCGPPKLAANGDLDGDGVINKLDECPKEDEDHDRFQDSDGCPDYDNDRDLIVDRKDKCPLDPEDRLGGKPGDGCPSGGGRVIASNDPDDVPLPSVAPVGSAGDRDGDGIIDDTDSCPDDPEDKDGFQDDDGCPDPDNDGDSVADYSDQCPNDAEDRDGFKDDDGCPDPDNDGDRVLDAQDKCPTESGARGRADGCPDSDSDGIADKDDSCDFSKEDIDGYQDGDGCPDPDNDGDRIPDDKDKCPNEKETFNGKKDGDGCAD